MPKIQCRCGHVLPDVSDRLPYKAYFHADEDDEAFWDGIVRETLGLLRAIREGNRKSYILDRFLPSYEPPQDDASLLGDALATHAARYLRDAFQCEACGRLMLETAPRSGTYRFFVPEDDESPILAAQDEPAAPS